MQHTTIRPNTYTQIYIHVVFTVQNRASLISDKWQERLYRYIIEIIKNYGEKVIIIGGMPDHIHIFYSLENTTCSVANLMRAVKGKSSHWINENKLVIGRFEWQTGYGAFSYSKSSIDNVVKYIQNQKKYHTNKTFIEEYKELLQKFGIKYEEKYIFHAIE